MPGASVIDGSDVQLTATYWDTAHRSLLGWGFTLRHRRASDGSEDRWTLKLAISRRGRRKASSDALRSTCRGRLCIRPPRSARRAARFDVAIHKVWVQLNPAIIRA